MCKSLRVMVLEKDARALEIEKAELAKVKKDLSDELRIREE